MEAALVDAMGRQTAVLLQMWEIVVQQREALKSGRLPVLQDLMRSLQGISAQARTEEASRDREARRLAAALGCDPCVSALAEALGDGGGARLRGAAEALTQAVKQLRAETQLLSRLVEESLALQQLLLAEYRRLEGSMTGTLPNMDFRG
ncbi:MAG TPA: flagellar export chaperone FlgN [Synergistaceae bacterium]|nr:flagellar export chaperone FlgN [Synergistaceae bacterium]